MVVVTSLLDEATLTQLRRLRAAGQRVALLLVGQSAPRFTEPGFTVHRIADEAAWTGKEEVLAV